MPNILINPNTGIIEFNTGIAGSAVFDTNLSGLRMTYDNFGAINLLSYNTNPSSGVDRFTIDGTNGRLFSVTDNLSGSLFSVNDIAGLPIIEAFDDNTVVMGAFNRNDFVLSGNSLGLGAFPNTGTTKLYVGGNLLVIGDILANNLVYNTGNQLISGNKTFLDRLSAKTGFFGENNLLSGSFLAIAGGINNFISGNNSFIGGGSTNRISGNNIFIGGGSANIVNRGLNSSIVAGSANLVDINSNCSFIGGGASNRTVTNGCLSVIGGGFSNCTACNGAVIGGGCVNRAFGDGAVVVGGCGNTASRCGGFVGGGFSNCVEAYASTIGGGFFNWVRDGSSCSFIGGGGGNQTLSNFSTVGGGQLNYALSFGASILGGLTSQIDGTSDSSSIVGGCSNRIAYTLGGTIGGGRFNCIESSPNAVIGGGCTNTICRAGNSYIVGGYLSNILVNHSGSAILADGQNRVHNSYSPHSLTLDFASGVYFSDKKIFGFVPEMVEVRNNFLISGNFNSDVIIANSPTIITGSIVSGNPIGFNASIIQTSSGQVLITGIGSNVIVSSYNNQFRTAAQYATISILHTGNNGYIMYGNTST